MKHSHSFLIYYISNAFIHWKVLEASKNGMMEKTKTRPVSNTVMFSSIFLAVICLSGLIHVEIELHVHRQMLQVLNKQREEKIEHRGTAHEDKQPMVKIPYSESNGGEY